MPVTNGLHLTIGESLDDLIELVVARLAVQVNPLERRTIVVPNSSVSQWLEQQLAQRLGRTENRRDGVVANLETIYPSSIENRYLYNDKRDRDLWSVERLALALLGARNAVSELSLADALRRAKELSDVLTLRPELLEQYVAAPENFRERSVVETLRAEGSPPPFEALQKFRAADHVLPETGLIVFGCNELTTGTLFPALLGTLAESCEVHVLLSTPSIPASRAFVEGEERDSLAVRWGSYAMAHLQTWIDASSPSTVTWTPSSATTGFIHPDRVGLEAALTNPKSRREGDPRESSIIAIHGAVGFARQVEIARDALLHAVKELGLRPHDLRIITTDPQRFAPLMEALWGWRRDDSDAPWLQFEAADPALPRASDRLDGFRQLLHAIDSHFTASDVLGILAQPAVQRGVGLKRSDIDRVTDLVMQAGVSVGLDAATRDVLGLFDTDDDTGTWVRFIDRTLLASVFEDEPDDQDSEQPRFEVRPLGAPEDIETFSRISRVVKSLLRWSVQSAASLPLAGWVDLFREWAALLGRDERIVDNALERCIEKLDQLSASSDVSLGFREVRSLFDRQASAIGGSSVLGRGGAPVVGIHALASTRARVTCFLGIDEDLMPAPFSPPAHLGEPRPGDPSPRERFRSDLLAAVLSTTERVIFLTNDRNVKDGSPINIALPLQELSDALRIGGVGHDGLVVPIRRHPRHVFTARLAPQDPKAAVDLDLAESPLESFTFDATAAKLAVTNFERRPQVPDADMPFTKGQYGINEEPDVIDLAHLLRFFKRPQQQFLATHVNGARINEQRDELPPVPRLNFDKGLEEWSVRNEYVRGLLEGTGSELLSGHVDGTLARIAPGMRASALKRLDLPTYQAFAEAIRDGLEEIDAQRAAGSEFPAVLSGLERPTSRPPVALYETVAGPLVLEWTVSAKPHSSILSAVLDMAATTIETGQDVRAIVLYTNSKKANFPARFVRLKWSAPSRESAVKVLNRATELYLELQEDAPLVFPKTTLGALGLDVPKNVVSGAKESWDGAFGGGGGEKADPERRLLFPFEYGDLLKVRDGRFTEVATTFKRLFNDIEIYVSHDGKINWVSELRGEHG